MTRLKHLLTFSNPLLLALVALTYTLGTGIARYLGRADHPLVFGMGFGWVILLLLAMNLLAIYFRPHNERLTEEETIVERNWLRAAAFQISIAALSVVALLTVFLLQQGVSPAALFFALLIFLAAIAYALPPLRLVTSGFGEFILAILFALLIPAFSLTLQLGELHRLLGAVAFPLAALALAFFLVLNFPAYKEDHKYERGSLLLRVGWQRAISLHHILIFSAYFLFAAMPFIASVPWAVISSVFLVMPFAIFQVYWMQQIANGVSPNYKFLTLLAITVLGLTTYTLTLTFWIR
ncbi:MAG: UbiA family prenyltransferase [Anaerolineae bacterium]|jgi:1,4-dihydroxy-2-naphthoate octaprenyltransferase|nr:UbiA family prenyltransferase [Anaerolineae bacterium]MBT7189279.1 UbiA family prenyltransferase [Anaerolineae bacterium]MBT7990127.1 UbiA family prenyltransferase [Anaerolineae bacterium]